MKPLLLLLFVNLLAAVAVAAEADRFSPAVPLDDALILAKNYVSGQKINLSNYYIKQIGLKFEEDGSQPHWEAQWMTTSKSTRGDWFIIRVDMEKRCSLILGK